MAINKRIVYTAHDGSVSVTCPSAEIFRIMAVGGYWDLAPRGFVERQIELQIKGGIDPDHARRFAHAVAFGGCTAAEVWDIVKDRDCARHGTLHELHDVDDIPVDRWFRDAWSRSRNGGPIGIDLEKARPLQWERLASAVDAENKRRVKAWYRRDPLQIDEGRIRDAISAAQCHEELKHVWIEGLPR